MSEFTDVEALIIVIFLVILSTVYGINEIKGAISKSFKNLCRTMASVSTSIEEAFAGEGKTWN